MAAPDQLSALFGALADPTRRQMLSRLVEGEMTVAELSRPFDLSAPAISKHLKVLERAGLIERGRNAQWRPCRLRVESLRLAADWFDDLRTAEADHVEVTRNDVHEPRDDQTEQVSQSGIDESHW